MSSHPTSPDAKTIELILKSLPVVAWFTNADHRVTWSCGDAARFLGGDETSDGDHDIRNLGEMNPLVAAHEAALDGRTVDIEMPSKDRSFVMRIQPLRNASATIIGCIGSGYDVTYGRRAEPAIFYQAAFDPVTGVLNRTHFRNRLARELMQARSASRELTVAIVSVDGLNGIAAKHCGSVADEFLRIVVSRIEAAVPQNMPMGRVEPDSFALILPSGAFDQVRAVCDAILSQFDDAILARDTELFASVSIGTATFPFDGRSAEHVLHAATSAVRRAQQLGGRRSQYFFSALATNSFEPSEIDQDIWTAVDRQDLFLVYQPQVRLDNGAVEGVEVLLRWRKNGNVLPAATIIPHLEETALIVPLGRWITDAAFAQLRDWRAAGIHVRRIAINVGARQLADESFLSNFRRSLARHEIPADIVDIEVSEASVQVNIDAAVRALHGLREIGTQVTLDDFGGGPSSFTSLRRLPLTGLKIDRSFIAGIPDSKTDDAILTSIITAAEKLGLRLVAEGVETAAQAGWLLGSGCTLAQGFFFSQPLGSDDAARFLQMGIAR